MKGSHHEGVTHPGQSIWALFDFTCFLLICCVHARRASFPKVRATITFCRMLGNPTDRRNNHNNFPGYDNRHEKNLAVPTSAPCSLMCFYIRITSPTEGHSWTSFSFASSCLSSQTLQ